MVRLRDVTADARPAFRSHFNSCMVRLRGQPIRPATIPKNKFQFLYGSIESRLITSLYSSLINFNSCMVRLRVILVPKDVLSWNPFQFLYGSIESLQKGLKNLFNGEFQFLYGSIESRNGPK